MPSKNTLTTQSTLAMNNFPEDEITNEDTANLIRDYRVPLEKDRLQSLNEKLEARAEELIKKPLDKTEPNDIGPNKGR